MNVAKDFGELFDSVTDVVHVAGGPDQVVFVAIARDALPRLIEGLEPQRVYLQHHGTPGVYELVLEHADQTVEPGPRPC